MKKLSFLHFSSSTGQKFGKHRGKFGRISGNAVAQARFISNSHNIHGIMAENPTSA